MEKSRVFEVLIQTLADGEAGSFIKSILEQYPNWSERQLHCARQNAEQEMARRARAQQQAQEPAAAPTQDLDPVRIMLQGAREQGHRKYPYVLMQAEGREYKISLTSAGKHPNQLTVNDVTDSDDKRWLGYILNGKMEFRVPVSAEFVATLERLALDPSAAAATYARATQTDQAEHGQCMFCRIELTVDESIKRSYGPVCARNYGLPFDYAAYRRKTGIGA